MTFNRNKHFEAVQVNHHPDGDSNNLQSQNAQLRLHASRLIKAERYSTTRLWYKHTQKPI